MLLKRSSCTTTQICNITCKHQAIVYRPKFIQSTKYVQSKVHISPHVGTLRSDVSYGIVHITSLVDSGYLVAAHCSHTILVIFVDTKLVITASQKGKKCAPFPVFLSKAKSRTKVCHRCLGNDAMLLSGYNFSDVEAQLMVSGVAPPPETFRLLRQFHKVFCSRRQF